MTPILSDNFPGSTLDTTKWYNGYGIFGNAGGSAPNASTQVTVANGVCSLTAHTDSSTGAPAFGAGYTTGTISSKAAMTYGLVTIVAQMSVGNGFWPAMYLMPDTPNGRGNPGGNTQIVPVNGIPEIDMLELPQSATGGQGTLKNEGHYTYHWTDISGAAQQSGSSVVRSDLTVGFHTYQISWTPDQILWLVDGVLFKSLSSTAAVIYGAPMYLIISNQLFNGGMWGTTPITVDGTTPLPGSMLIESVTMETPLWRFAQGATTRYRLKH